MGTNPVDKQYADLEKMLEDYKKRFAGDAIGHAEMEDIQRRLKSLHFNIARKLDGPIR